MYKAIVLSAFVISFSLALSAGVQSQVAAGNERGGVAPRGGQPAPAPAPAPRPAPPHPALPTTTLAAANFYSGGVVDASNMLLYSYSTKNVIQVIDLNNGALKATFPQGEYPIALNADGLLAAKMVNDNSDNQNQKDMVIVNLDPQSGDLKTQSSAMAFPEWVPVSLGFSSSFSSSFSTRFTVDENSVVTLDWQAATSYRGGAYPSPWILRNSHHEAVGEFKVGMKDSMQPGAITASWTCTADGDGTLPCKLPEVQQEVPMSVNGEYVLAQLDLGGAVTYMEVQAAGPTGGRSYGEIPISVKAVDKITKQILFTVQIGSIYVTPPPP